MVILGFIEIYCHFLTQNTRTYFAISLIIDCIKQIRRAVKAPKLDINDSIILTVISLALAKVRNIICSLLFKSYGILLKLDSFSGEMT